MRCLLYYNLFSRTEPFLTLGPDWQYALGAFLLFNFVYISILANAKYVFWLNWLASINIVMINFFYLLTVFVNPGMAPIDPDSHHQEYLKNVA